MQVVQKLERSESTLTLILGPGAFSWRRVTDVSRDATEGGPSQLKEGNMLRTIVVAIGVSIMVVGGVLPANADDDDKGAKKQHQAILNAVKSDTDSDTAAHAAQSADHAALSHKVDEVRTAIGNISMGGSGGGDQSGLPPTWDKVLSADNPTDPCNSSRFKCVMPTGTNLNFDAVRDNETGLVWEKSPTTTFLQWGAAIRLQCADRMTGGRKGWRLPSFAELASLVDPAVPINGTDPTLPSGHPFSNVQANLYWSATTHADVPLEAWSVNFISGTVFPFNKAFFGFVWCVRGAMNADQY